MNSKEVLQEVLRTARFVMSTYLRDMTDADIHCAPAPGAHTAAWQLGHLLISERAMIDGISSGAGIELPERFEAEHAKDAIAGLSGERLEKRVYEELMHRQRSRTLQVLDQLSESDLSLPAPEFVRAYAPCVGSVFSAIGGHELMHSGQIAVLRRVLNKPVVI